MSERVYTFRRGHLFDFLVLIVAIVLMLMGKMSPIQGSLFCLLALADLFGA